MRGVLSLSLPKGFLTAKAIMTKTKSISLICPGPPEKRRTVTLAHGGGGMLMNELLEQLIFPCFDNETLQRRHDGAVLQLSHFRVALTTDSFVVQPLFFPGGDIGTLAINGTVNDLAMCGATPQYLSAAFILEEGFSLETFERIVESMGKAAEQAGVQLVTGDTKVVDKGKGDGIFITTTGLGEIRHEQEIAPQCIAVGDVILINGDIGRHGMAIMAQREGLSFESEITSDCAPLSALVLQLIDQGIELHCLRDLTRGGLATGLVELAETAGRTLEFTEALIPVRNDVQGACELLGLDPLYVANEGRFVAVVPADHAERALAIMRQHPLGENASRIGQVRQGKEGRVLMINKLGVERIIDRLSGEQLPRIC